MSTVVGGKRVDQRTIVDPKSITEMEKEEDNLLNKLLSKLMPNDQQGNDDELRVISILDSEAMCKTAMARSVYGRVDVKSRFAHRAWIYVQDNASVQDVLANILRQISTRDFKNIDQAEKDTAYTLYRSLYGYFIKQRYLVVLDNMNSVDVMLKLLGFLVDPSNGSRVIITTANVNLPYSIDPWAEPIEFEPLTIEDRKLLLLPWLNESEPGGQVPPAQSPLMKNISSCCSRKENPPLVDIVSSCYEDLSPELQRCTMYICQFPREYDIPTRRLLRLWLAEDLVPLTDRGIQDAESDRGIPDIQDAEKCFDKLVRANMLYVVSRGKKQGFAKTCRMPGFIYDFLLRKALYTGFFDICSNDSSANIPNKGLKFVAPRIVVDNGRGPLGTQDQTDRTQYNAKQIRSYISFNTKKIRMQKGELDIFVNPRGEESELKVLDLEGVYRPVLPKDLGKVFWKLKYLGLRWTILSELPKFVCDLPDLETLDVKHTNITKIPSSIWTKESLRHLYLNELKLDKSISHHWRLSPFRKLRKVNNLQTLSGLHLESKSSISDVLSKLTVITELSLTCASTVAKEVIKQIMGLTTLQSLKLKSKGLVGQPLELHVEGMEKLSSLCNLYLFGKLRSAELPKLPESLKSLTLSMTFLDNMDHLGTLQQLTDLRLYGYSYDGNDLKMSNKMFPKLRTLKMWKLDELKTFIVEKEAGPSLEVLDIRDCQKLEEIDISQDRKALKEVSLAKVNEELAKSLRKRLQPSIIITTELTASTSSTAKKGH